MTAKIERIYFRVNSSEKKKIEELAKNAGYENVSDFMREYLLYKIVDKEELSYIVSRLNKLISVLK